MEIVADYSLPAPTPSHFNPEDVEPLLELGPLGNVTRRLGCARGLAPRFHDVLVEPDGFSEVTGTVVQHLDPAGGVVFEWSAFDHFAITDLDPKSRSGQAVNWTHGNSLDFDADDNLLVSFRSLSEITSIDTRTGAVRWRMGGLRNQFTFADAGPPFLRQHDLLVAYGDGGAVREYDADGSVVWEIEGDPGYVFRAQRIRSLYHPGEGLVR